jgi:hypothetical protein
MITDALLAVLRVIMDALWLFLAPFDWAGQGITAGISAFVLECRRYNAYAPVSEFFTLSSLHLSIFFSITAHKWMIKIFDWIANVIP